MKPILGRAFQPGDDRPGAEPIVVLSHGLWQQEFGGDENVVGRRVTIGGQQATIAGVMPRGLLLPDAGVSRLATPAPGSRRPRVRREWLAGADRSRPGPMRVPPRSIGTRAHNENARRALHVSGRVGQDQERARHADPEYLLGSVKDPLLLLMGAVALLLLIACANAAALILARTTDRTGELSGSTSR